MKIRSSEMSVALLAELRYESLPYPKSATTRHEVREAQIQTFLFGGDHERQA